MTARILVLGADIAAGKRAALALAADPSIECVIAVGRSDRNRVFAEQIGARVLKIDAEDATSVRKALDGAFAVVQAGGSFQFGNYRYRVAEQCVKCAVHYVDMASAREHVTGIKALNAKAEASSSLIVAGATSVPAISSALVDSLTPEFDRMGEIHVAVCSADADTSWLAMGRALLPSVGRVIRVRQMGRWRDTHAWSEPEKVEFPAPAGLQRVYLCDFPDLDLFPILYGALTVSARAGLQKPLLNNTLAALGRLKRRKSAKASITKPTNRDRVSSGFQKLVDTITGIHVHVLGQQKGTAVRRSACLIARSDSGTAMSCSPAIALIKKWTHEGVSSAGAMPCIGLLTLDAIRSELAGHDIMLVRS
jgi:saccharopine dehydrogenase-like NADP-dependent oxidoreductase